MNAVISIVTDYVIVSGPITLSEQLKSICEHFRLKVLLAQNLILLDDWDKIIPFQKHL